MGERRPDFFLVGAPKCGTTTLADCLAQHPQVHFSSIKEPNFFGRDTSPPLRVESPEAYRTLFEAAGDRVAGEGSTSYFFSTTAADEIRQFAPNARILIVLRDPAKTVASWHQHLLRDLEEDITDVNEAVRAEPERARGERLPTRCERPWLLQYTRLAQYADRVNRYVDRFGSDAVHVMLFEDFLEDPAGVLGAMYAFLGVRNDFEPTIRQWNPAWQPRNVLIGRLRNSRAAHRLTTMIQSTPLHYPAARLAGRLFGQADTGTALRCDTRAMLRDAFRDDIRRLECILGRDLRGWLDMD